MYRLTILSDSGYEMQLRSEDHGNTWLMVNRYGSTSPYVPFNGDYSAVWYR